MIVCPSCQHRNPESTALCLSCGISLEHFFYRACPSCGALNPAENTFCQRCLSELVPLPGSEEPTEATTEEPSVEDEPLITRGVKWHLREGEEPPPKEEKKPAPEDKPVTSKALSVLPPEEPEQQADIVVPTTVEPLAPEALAIVAEEPVDEVLTAGVQPPAEGAVELPPIEPLDPAEEPATFEPALIGELEAEEPVEVTAPTAALSVDERFTVRTSGSQEEESPQELIVATEAIEEDALIERMVIEPEEMTLAEQLALEEAPTTVDEDEVGAEDKQAQEPAFVDDLFIAPGGLAAALPDTTARPLEGLSDLLPLEASIAVPHRAAPLAIARPNETDQFDAELFRQIAGEQAPLREPLRRVIARQRGLMPRLGRTLLYLLVLLAALTPMFTGGLTTGWTRPRDSVVALAKTIPNLPSGSVVLVAFDYGPAYAGEIDPLALAVVQHLAVRSVRTIALSTQPEGVGIAERIYRTASREAPGYHYGEHYVIAGYLPGQEMGLRALNSGLQAVFKVDQVMQRPLGELALTREITRMADVDQIILLADDGQTVRRWIEQIGSQHPIPLHALVTSAAEPMLVPYQQAGQLRSLVGAAMGSLEYPMAARVGQAALRSADAYAALFVLLLGVALVTNLVDLGGRQRDPSHDS